MRLALETALGALDPAGMEMYETEIVAWLEPLDRFVAVSRVDGDLLRAESVLLVD